MDLGAIFAREANRPLVVCDIDNTLAFQAEAVAVALNARFGTNWTPARFTAYPFSALLEPEQARWLTQFTGRDAWIASLAPDHNAIAALGKIRAAGHKVIVSSDRRPELADATREWLAAHAVPMDGTVLNGPGSKRAALAQCTPDDPGVLIDDDARTWLTVARPGVTVWTPQRPWTPASWRQYPGVRVFGTWAEPVGRLSA